MSSDNVDILIQDGISAGNAQSEADRDNSDRDNSRVRSSVRPTAARTRRASAADLASSSAALIAAASLGAWPVVSPACGPVAAEFSVDVCGAEEPSAAAGPFWGSFTPCADAKPSPAAIAARDVAIKACFMWRSQ